MFLAYFLHPFYANVPRIIFQITIVENSCHYLVNMKILYSLLYVCHR